MFSKDNRFEIGVSVSLSFLALFLLTDHIKLIILCFYPQVCLDMNAKFTSNAGIYGASLLELRRSELPTVKQISRDMEELRAKISDGGQELSLVDGKFLEETRDILGRLKGTICTTLSMFYVARG